MKNFKRIIAISLCLSFLLNLATGFSFANSKNYLSKTKNTIKYISTEKELINALSKELISQKSKIKIPVDFTKLNMNKINQALKKVQLQPEILSIKESWEGVSSFVVNGKYTLTLNVTYFKGAKNLYPMINKWVKENISANMTEEEKVRSIHDYIVLKTAYNYGDSNYKVNGYPVNSPIGLLNQGAGICQGYALLFYTMAKKAGLNVLYVSADVHNSNEGHAWNMVSVDGKFYHIDVTWDDPIPNREGRVLYDYYLKGDEFMSKTHKWDKSKFPKANSDYKNFANKIDNNQFNKNISSYYNDNNSLYNQNNEYIDYNNLDRKSNNIKDYGAIQDAPPAKTTEPTEPPGNQYENYIYYDIPINIPYPISGYDNSTPVSGYVDFDDDYYNSGPISGYDNSIPVSGYVDLDND